MFLNVSQHLPMSSSISQHLLTQCAWNRKVAKKLSQRQDIWQIDPWVSGINVYWVTSSKRLRLKKLKRQNQQYLTLEKYLVDFKRFRIRTCSLLDIDTTYPRVNLHMSCFWDIFLPLFDFRRTVVGLNRIVKTMIKFIHYLHFTLSW